MKPLFVVALVAAQAIEWQPQVPKLTSEQTQRAQELLVPLIVHVEADFTATTKERPSAPWKGREVGTGFFVDSKGDIATAAHVICRGDLRRVCIDGLTALALRERGEHLTNTSEQDLHVYIRYQTATNQYSKKIPVAILAVDSLQDVALLRPLVTLPKAADVDHVNIFGNEVKLATLDGRDVRLHQLIRADGFPAGEDLDRNEYGFVGEPDLKSPSKKKAFAIQVVLSKIIEGSSGGPITDMTTGKIIGVLTGGYSAPGTGGSDRATVSPIFSVKSLLEIVKNKTQQ